MSLSFYWWSPAVVRRVTITPSRVAMNGYQKCSLWYLAGSNAVAITNATRTSRAGTYFGEDVISNRIPRELCHCIVLTSCQIMMGERLAYNQREECVKKCVKSHKYKGTWERLDAKMLCIPQTQENRSGLGKKGGRNGLELLIWVNGQI